MFFAVSFVSAVALYAGPGAALVASLVTAAGVAAVLITYGTCLVQVDEGGLRAGSALLEWDGMGTVVSHDPAATDVRLGTGADPAAWLMIRGYVHESVEVAVADPGDPHPYWLLSTRHPQDLVAAIEQARSSRAKGPEVPAG